MLQLEPLDENVPIFQQLGTDQSPVVLVNVFHVAQEDIPALLQAWEADANWMKAQPGYVSTQALGHYPSSAVASPHLFTRLTVPNLCVGP